MNKQPKPTWTMRFKCQRISNKHREIEVLCADRGLIGEQYISEFEVEGVRFTSAAEKCVLDASPRPLVVRESIDINELAKHDVDLRAGVIGFERIRP